MGVIRDLVTSRATSIVLRSLHVVTMGVLLGGVASGAPAESLRLSIHLTVASGVLLLLCDRLAGRLVLSQGSGVAMLLKLALLALGNVCPAHRLPWYLASTFVASLGSHMPGAWRHFSFVEWRVVERRGHP